MSSSYSHLTIGVLSLQGAFSKHLQAITALGAQGKEVRKPQDLHSCHGLIVPGGESTTIAKQLKQSHLVEPIQAFMHHSPLFGTCAGLILLSKQVERYEELELFSLFPLTIQRNAFGRQTHSFQTPLTLKEDSSPFLATFIRAPQIIEHSQEVKVLATYQNKPQLIAFEHHLGSTFHPELGSDLRIHELFLKRCLAQKIVPSYVDSFRN